MKLKDINGRETSINHKNSDAPYKSNIQAECGAIIQDFFPFENLWKEFTIPGSRLSIDFLLPRRKLVVEVDGRQHDEYVAHFHGHPGKKGFAESKKRDTMKEQWCSENGFLAIRVKTANELRESLRSLRGDRKV